MAHSASHRRDHHKQDEGASLLTYKGRAHWPRTKFHLEMHFDSHGLQGLIVRGLVNRPEGGFITININPTTMSVININNTGADGTARGSFTGLLGCRVAGQMVGMAVNHGTCPEGVPAPKGDLVPQIPA